METNVQSVQYDERENDLENDLFCNPEKLWQHGKEDVI
jgi:hypothetical protein